MIGAFSPDSSQLAVILESESTEPVRLLDPNTMEPTTKLAFPGGKPVSGVDVQFSADGRYLAATVHTVPLVEQDASETPGYAVVWDLRSPSTPPVRVPTGIDVQGMALSPDGRTLYTAWPLTAYDVASGERIWRREDVTTAYATLDVNAEGTLLALRGPRRRPRTRSWWMRPPARRSARCVGTGTASDRDIRFSPDGSLVGSVSSDGELIVWDTATGRPLERWDTFDPWGVGFSPDNDLVYGGGGRLDAAHLGPVRGGHVSAADHPGRRRRGVRARRHLPRRAAGGLSLARRQGHGMGQVRRHRHRRSDARDPPSGGRRPVAPRHLASPGWAVRRILRRGARNPASSVSSTPPRASSSGNPGTLSTATAISGHWRTSTRVAACSRATRTAPILIVDAETLRPRGEPFDVVGARAAPPRSGTGAPRWSTSTPRRRFPCTGG